jgi:hypothetical protein
LKDAPGNEEILTEVKNLKEKWSEHVGKEEWKKIEMNIQEDITLAKQGKIKKRENLNVIEKEKEKEVKQQPTGGAFKKMKIVEEDIPVEENVDTKKEIKKEIIKEEPKTSNQPTPTTSSSKNSNVKIEIKQEATVVQEITPHLSKYIQI